MHFFRWQLEWAVKSRSTRTGTASSGKRSRISFRQERDACLCSVAWLGLRRERSLSQVTLMFFHWGRPELLLRWPAKRWSKEPEWIETWKDTEDFDITGTISYARYRLSMIIYIVHFICSWSWPFPLIWDLICWWETLSVETHIRRLHNRIYLSYTTFQEPFLIGELQ